MATEYIYKRCPPCGGTGTIVVMPLEDGEPDNTCPSCKGAGKYLWGYLQDELEGEE